MIDDKEIDIAARAQALSKHINETAYFQLRSIEDFKDGARWAINEFLKDLWHPASEEPNHEAIRTYILGETEASESGILPMLLRQNTNWKEFVVSHSVTNWLYVDDLLPKEGGEK
jgi:hypothetical protein